MLAAARCARHKAATVGRAEAPQPCIERQAHPANVECNSKWRMSCCAARPDGCGFIRRPNPWWMPLLWFAKRAKDTPILRARRRMIQRKFLPTARSATRKIRKKHSFEVGHNSHCARVSRPPQCPRPQVSDFTNRRSPIPVETYGSAEPGMSASRREASFSPAIDRVPANPGRFLLAACY